VACWLKKENLDDRRNIFETYNSLSNIFLSIYVDNSFVLKINCLMEQHQYTPEWGQAQISIENRDPNLLNQIFRQDYFSYRLIKLNLNKESFISEQH